MNEMQNNVDYEMNESTDMVVPQTENTVCETEDVGGNNTGINLVTVAVVGAAMAASFAAGHWAAKKVGKLVAKSKEKKAAAKEEVTEEPIESTAIEVDELLDKEENK